MSAKTALGWRQDAPVIGIIGLAHAGSHFSHLILPPLFPFIVADVGLSYVDLGLAMTVFFAASGVLQVLAGFMVDRLGAERILVGGLVFLGFGALAAAWADSFMSMVIATALLGIGNSVFHPADYAILGHHVSSSRLGRAFGIHTLGGSLGWAVAPPLMTFLALSFSWWTALIVAAIAIFLIALSVVAMTGRLRIEQGESSERRSLEFGFLRERAVLMCFLFFTLQAFAIMAFQNFSPVALNTLYNIEMTTAALILSAFLLGSSAGTLVGGIAADRNLGLETSIAAGYGLAGICFLIVGSFHLPEIAIYLTLTLAGFFKGFTAPSRDLLIRSVAGPGRTGSVFGVVYSGLDLGSTAAPYLAALMFDAGRPELFFPMLAAVSMLTIWTVFSARSERSREVPG